MIANRAVALVYRLVAVVSAVAGLSLLLDLGTGRPDWGAFLYYTGMSNLLCLVWLTAGLVTAIRGLRREGTIGSATSHPRTGAAVMMAITVTMLIYLTMLEPPHSPNVLDWFQQYDATNLLVHIATPCLVVLDWFLFAPKGRLRWFDPLLWLLIPLGYLGFSWLWAAAGGASATSATVCLTRSSTSRPTASRPCSSRWGSCSSRSRSSATSTSAWTACWPASRPATAADQTRPPQDSSKNASLPVVSPARSAASKLSCSASPPVAVTSTRSSPRATASNAHRSDAAPCSG